MIQVYFERKLHADLIATFEDEKVYFKVVDKLEKIALLNGYDKITESLVEDPAEDFISLKEYRLFTEWREKKRYFNFNDSINKWMYTFEASVKVDDNYLSYSKTTKELLTKFRKENGI